MHVEEVFAICKIVGSDSAVFGVEVVKNGEHRDTREVSGRVAEGGKIDCRYGLEKLALEIGGNTGVKCELIWLAKNWQLTLVMNGPVAPSG